MGPNITYELLICINYFSAYVKVIVLPYLRDRDRGKVVSTKESSSCEVLSETQIKEIKS